MSNSKRLAEELERELRFESKLEQYYRNCLKEKQHGLIPDEVKDTHAIITELLRVIVHKDDEALDDFLKGQDIVFGMLGGKTDVYTEDDEVVSEMECAFKSMKDEATKVTKG